MEEKKKNKILLIYYLISGMLLIQAGNELHFVNNIDWFIILIPIGMIYIFNSGIYYNKLNNG